MSNPRSKTIKNTLTEGLDKMIQESRKPKTFATDYGRPFFSRPFALPNIEEPFFLQTDDEDMEKNDNPSIVKCSK